MQNTFKGEEAGSLPGVEIGEELKVVGIGFDSW